MEIQTTFFVLILNILLKCVVGEEWTHHTVLDGNGKYNLYWKPPEDKKANNEIIFQAEVEAKGFIGFGLSPNGGMKGSDIVTGWVKDGKVYFQDRHGIGKTLPPKDEKQDWTLLDAKENDTHTVLKFSRKLDTCDEDDMVIDDSTMRLIYSFSEEDPKSENPFYHGMNRGTKSALLLQTQTKSEPTKDESKLPYWDVQSPNVDISKHRTLYWCKIFKSPDLDKKHHIVHVKPLIQEGHEEFVHHMLLYECVGGTDDEYSELLDYDGHECHHPNMPEPMQKCEGVSVGWAVGGNDLVFPEHVGMPLEQIPGTYYMLELHYDNPMRRQGIIDNSGLRIFYTPELRKYDAGCLMIGSAVSPRLLVPPGQENYVVAGHSNPECLGSAMPEDGVKGLGVLLHAHLMGREIKARHFRGDTELPPLAVEHNYDFNYQEYRYYEEEMSILPGDQITVECRYDSTKRKNVSFGGLSTKDEMCLAFVLYYPRIDRYASLSAPPLSTINEVFNTNFASPWDLYQLTEYDWSKINVKDVEKRFRFGEHSSLCYFGNGQKDAFKSMVSYPENLQAFAPPASVCQKGDIVLDPNCPEPNGMFPDPKNCSSFYHCDEGVAYHQACSPPLMFNPVKNTCDWPYNVKCEKD